MASKTERFLDKGDLFTLGLFITMVSGLILYLTNGKPFLHYTSIIYFGLFVGVMMTIRAFKDTNEVQDE